MCKYILFIDVNECVQNERKIEAPTTKPIIVGSYYSSTKIFVKLITYVAYFASVLNVNVAIHMLCCER